MSDPYRLSRYQSCWNWLTDPLWVTCSSAEEVEQKTRLISGWGDIPAGNEKWNRAVVAALGQQTSIWGQLFAHNVLKEAMRRGWPLDVTSDGKEASWGNPVAWGGWGAPAWLEDLRVDLRNNGAQRRAEHKAFSVAKLQLMGASSPQSFRQQSTANGRVPSPFEGIPLSAALLVFSRNLLCGDPFRRGSQPVLLGAAVTADRKSRWLRGLMRWVDQEVRGSAGSSALLVGWAAAHSLHRDEQDILRRGNGPAMLEQNREQFQKAIDLAEKMLDKRGVRSKDDYQKLALATLEQPSWGQPLTVMAAVTIARSWGKAWGEGSEQVWAKALAVLPQDPEAHWRQVPLDEHEKQTPTRRIIRDAISAVTDHLGEPPQLIPVEDVVSALEQALPPVLVTEALSQVWVSAQVKPQSEGYWTNCVKEWLAKAPAEAGACWEATVSAHWRDQDGPREVVEAKAREMGLDARLGASEPSVKKPRTRL